MATGLKVVGGADGPVSVGVAAVRALACLPSASASAPAFCLRCSAAIAARSRTAWRIRAWSVDDVAARAFTLMTRFAVFVCTFGYIGYVPFAPGTVGSAAGVVLYH